MDAIVPQNAEVRIMPTSAHDATISHDALCEKPQACQCDIREMGWLAREALALTSDKEPWLFSLARPAEYTTRKRALLAYIEATR
jgi:hypothetical protein